MAVGMIDAGVLADIANAVRKQNGLSAKYRASDLAAAIAELDGQKAGEGAVEKAPAASRGLISTDTLTAIAKAIRAQNGLTDTYKPGQMAAAILDLTWTVEVKPRAALFEDGSFIVCCSATVPTGHGARKGLWDIDAAGYADSKSRPWYSARNQVKAVTIDASMYGAGIKSIAWWFEGMGQLEYVYGFDCLDAVTDATRAFSGCSHLYSIFCSGSFDSSALASAQYAFASCSRLVGLTGYCPTSSDGVAAFSTGDAGVLSVDGPADTRYWTWAALFDDGSVEIGDAPVETDARKIVDKAQICAQGRYRATGCVPWSSKARTVKSARIGEIAAGSSVVWNTDYWFYGCSALTSIEGLSKLKAVCEMRYFTYGCSTLGEIDLTGVSPAGLEDLRYTFASCAALRTIKVDKNWTLPEGIRWNSSEGMQTFMGCSSLVGGNGTAWEKSKLTGAMAIVDTAETPGYLTGV